VGGSAVFAIYIELPNNYLASQLNTIFTTQGYYNNLKNISERGSVVFTIYIELPYDKSKA